MTDALVSDRPAKRLTLTGQYVRLADFAIAAGAIERIDFIDCQVVGPAVISPLNCNLTGSEFDNDPRSIAVLVEEGTPILAGSIIARDCNFHGCVFRRVTFAVTQPGYSALVNTPVHAAASK